jgi:hypothetical protein
MKRASHGKIHTHSVRRSTAWRFGLQCDLLREPFPRYGYWTRLPTNMLPGGRTEHATYPASAPRHRKIDVAREPFLAGNNPLYRLDLAVSYIPILTMSSIPHLQACRLPSNRHHRSQPDSAVPNCQFQILARWSHFPAMEQHRRSTTVCQVHHGRQHVSMSARQDVCTSDLYSTSPPRETSQDPSTAFGNAQGYLRISFDLFKQVL